MILSALYSLIQFLSLNRLSINKMQQQKKGKADKDEKEEDHERREEEFDPDIQLSVSILFRDVKVTKPN